MVTQEDRILGCLLGGAIGDALGAPVEFMSIDEIRRSYGQNGIADLEIAYERSGAITDDTQMTLFSAEGLLRHRNAMLNDEGLEPEVAPFVHRSYLRWLATQGIGLPPCTSEAEIINGWLITCTELWSRRAPGSTCISSLRSGVCGTIAAPVSNSKGCGGVMRVAPAAFFGGDAFQVSRDLAAITHGHPAGYNSAGALAQIIANILRGQSIADAVRYSIDRLEDEDIEGSTTDALLSAIKMADRGVACTPETIAELGAGWTGDEAIAIAVFCALSAPDFTSTVLLAANHSGDSDTTASLAGSMIGAAAGVNRLPAHWLEQLEIREIIETLASDLASHLDGVGAGNDLERYPPS